MTDTLCDLARKHGWYGGIKIGLIRTAVRRDLIDHKRKADAAFRRAVRFTSSESIPEGFTLDAQWHNGSPINDVSDTDDALVDDLLSCLDSRSRHIVAKCVIGGQSQRSVAAELGLSRAMVGKIRAEAVMCMARRYEKHQ